VEEIAPRLLRYCLGETGDRGLAEEAAQEGLAALVQRWRRQGPPESPAAFAFAVARRRAWRLKLRRRLFAPLPFLPGGHSPPPRPGAGGGGGTRPQPPLPPKEAAPGPRPRGPLFGRRGRAPSRGGRPPLGYLETRAQDAPAPGTGPPAKP